MGFWQNPGIRSATISVEEIAAGIGTITDYATGKEVVVGQIG